MGGRKRRLMYREEDKDFRLDEHLIVHDEAITEEQLRIFTEKQTNVCVGRISSQSTDCIGSEPRSLGSSPLSSPCKL